MANKLVTVARAGYLLRAYYFKQLLDTAGIENVIINQGLDGAQGGNEIEVQVEEEDLPRALEIVEEARAGYEPKYEAPFPKPVPIRSILVPVDFSEFSLHAAKYALHVARQKDAAIQFIHAYYDVVTNPVSYESFYSYPSDLRNTQHELEQETIAQMDVFMRSVHDYMDIEGIQGVKPKSRIMAGTADDVILSMIESGLFDLIILGAHAIVPSDSWFEDFTSILVEKSTIPVLAIPEDAVYRKSNAIRLMYATNFDKSDGSSIRKLIAIAAPLPTKIFVVHIDVTDDNAFINFDLSHFKEKYIGNIDSDMEFDLIVNENLVEGIKEFIAEKQIDILAVTSHKRNIITQLLHPSVAKELVSQISIPLLVFHPTQ